MCSNNTEFFKIKEALNKPTSNMTSYINFDQKDPYAS